MFQYETVVGVSLTTRRTHTENPKTCYSVVRWRTDELEEYHRMFVWNEKKKTEKGGENQKNQRKRDERMEGVTERSQGGREEQSGREKVCWQGVGAIVFKCP